ncbi:MULTISPECIES: hypothetical protein [Idiomarina]|jgi:hypothetical protein|uniref:Cytochrome oxidase Cu insertion factor, SCO1/SenC/PrrC family n=2 Tax=Idiomarina TaxID=135575 RepID=A0A837NEC2_9GAMM|nr:MULTISPECIES: hypothetical protein [Idiomarina]KTG28917.1 hypothetical protein AUR68_12465 [Idiomarina sp. H105]MCH2454093.1 hypothetical protein [Idiomarina sp.]OAF09682.1 hypothetical protein AWR38_12480 [Idiomarina sp. WRN-38]KPD24343.1 hypothetical protein AFK76_04965 [Idiomarina zobellii]RUO64598.1 hypothetical protein CWI73_07865 [Idiomarina piscisalsi]|tara:strand:+ start:220 stop:765 length:546 start_codon:yes stop_codon:yes gene_type:complete
MSSPNRSRKAILTVFALFLLPVIAAWVILSQNWYEAGTNKGTLLQPPVTLSSEVDTLPEGWKLGYIPPENCDQTCKNALYVMNQVDVAIGKDTDRLTPVTFHDNNDQLSDYERDAPQITPITAPAIIRELHNLPANTLFIIDPMHNVMLYYPTHSDKEAMIKEGKNVLADLRKLLKLSRIG